MILEPREGNCPKCDSNRLCCAASWLQNPDGTTCLGETWFCTGCKHIWKQQLDKGEEDIT